MRDNPGAYEAFGGLEACRRLSTAFYTRAQRDPVLAPLFPSLHCAIDAFTVYLAQLLGGPCDYSQRRWSLSLRDAHQRFKIGPKEQRAWLKQMRKTLVEVQAPEPLRAALEGFFERASAGLVNRGEPVREGTIHPEIAHQWDLHCATEEIVAAIRKGDRDGAVALADSAVLQECFAH